MKYSLFVMDNTPIIDGSLFKWERRNHGKANASEIGVCMPRQLRVRSHKTGEILDFSVDLEDPMAEDGWDGELVKLVDKNRKVFLTIWSY
ncbi:MAG: hypothetical protein EB120_04370 [Proteobacteria bacterium]|nr:hypothetical protein [Pseudomonadota bacterium]